MVPLSYVYKDSCSQILNCLFLSVWYEEDESTAMSVF